MRCRDRGACLDEQLASAQDEAGIGVADARSKLAEGAGIAGVRVRAEEHLPCRPFKLSIRYGLDAGFCRVELMTSSAWQTGQACFSRDMLCFRTS